MLGRMNPVQLADWLAKRGKGEKDFVLLDVREPCEIAVAAIPGAFMIPMGELATRYLELNPDIPTVVLCHHGVRSFHAASFLEAQDFRELYNLSGGIDAYSKQVDDSIPIY